MKYVRLGKLSLIIIARVKSMNIQLHNLTLTKCFLYWSKLHLKKFIFVFL